MTTLNNNYCINEHAQCNLVRQGGWWHLNWDSWYELERNQWNGIKHIKHRVSRCVMPFHCLRSRYYCEPSSPQQPPLVSVCQIWKLKTLFVKSTGCVFQTAFLVKMPKYTFLVGLTNCIRQVEQTHHIKMTEFSEVRAKFGPTKNVTFR